MSRFNDFISDRLLGGAIDALVGIPDSDHKQALIALADFSVKRRS